MEIVINYWAVLLATVLSIILGMLWYGPLFGKQWMKTIGVTKEDIAETSKKSMQKTYAIMAISTFIMAFVQAHLLFFASTVTGTEGVLAGITAAIWNWLGLIAPVTLGLVLWENRSWKYWFITSGYYLVSLSIMSVVLAVWQ